MFRGTSKIPRDLEAKAVASGDLLPTMRSEYSLQTIFNLYTGSYF